MKKSFFNQEVELEPVAATSLVAFIEDSEVGTYYTDEDGDVYYKVTDERGEIYVFDQTGQQV